MVTMTDIAALVEIDPHYMDGTGWPIVAGTGVPVAVLVCSLQLDHMTPEEIAENWTLSMEQVHAALAYYYANREQIDRQIAEAAEEGDRLAAAWPSKLPAS